MKRQRQRGSMSTSLLHSQPPQTISYESSFYSFSCPTLVIFCFLGLHPQWSRKVIMPFPSFQRMGGSTGSLDSERGDLATLSLAVTFGEHTEPFGASVSPSVIRGNLAT